MIGTVPGPHWKPYDYPDQLEKLTFFPRREIFKTKEEWFKSQRSRWIIKLLAYPGKESVKWGRNYSDTGPLPCYFPCSLPYPELRI